MKTAKIMTIGATEGLMSEKCELAKTKKVSALLVYSAIQLELEHERL